MGSLDRRHAAAVATALARQPQIRGDTLRADDHNEQDELIDFWSDDRSEDVPGVPPVRWSTPIGDYRDPDGMRLPTHGSTVWLRPDGPAVYGEFQVRSIRHDISAETAAER